MLTDRRLAWWTNGLAGGLMLAVVGGVGFLTWIARKNERSLNLAARAGTSLLQEGPSSPALQAEKRGEFALAERLYRRSDDRKARLALGRLLAQSGRRREAWRVLRPIVEGSGHDLTADAYAWYADLAIQFGDTKRAEAAARRAMPTFAAKVASGGKRLIAWSHLWADQPSLPRPSALRHVERAVELAPDLVAARLQLSNALRAVHRPWEPSVEAAVRLAERGTYGDWAALAEFYADHGRGEPARKALDRAFRKVPPRDARAWLSLASLGWRFSAFGEHRPQEAWEAVARDVRPDDAETLLALAWNSMGKEPDRAMIFAEAAYRAAKVREPERLIPISRAFDAGGRRARSIEVLRAALLSLRGADRAEAQARIDQPGRRRAMSPREMHPGIGYVTRPYGIL